MIEAPSTILTKAFIKGISLTLQNNVASSILVTSALFELFPAGVKVTDLNLIGASYPNLQMVIRAIEALHKRYHIPHSARHSNPGTNEPRIYPIFTQDIQQIVNSTIKGAHTRIQLFLLQPQPIHLYQLGPDNPPETSVLESAL